MKPKLFIFVLGLIVGLLVAYFVPPLVQGWLPEGMGGGGGATNGLVVAKQLEQDRLLLTIESNDGAVLATFRQRVPEINLLVDRGDQVTLGITSYEPFVEDPKILGVKKADMLKPGAGADLGTERSGMSPAPQGDGTELGNGATMGAGDDSQGAEKGDAAAGDGSDAPLPPMGPPLEDQPNKPAAGDGGGGTHPG